MTDEKNREAADKKPKKNRFIEIIAILFLIAGMIWMASLFFDFSNSIKTNNAQVDADIAAVTSRVTGNIKAIKFNEFGVVHAGDTLVLLNDEEFVIKVAQAEADLAIAQANLAVIKQAVITSKSSENSTAARLKGNAANLEKAEKNYKRFTNMFRDSAVTLNQYDQVTAQLKSEEANLQAMKSEVIASKSVTEQNQLNIESAKATVQRKEADLAAAKLQLSYTKIVATADGIVGERTIHAGELVNVNQVVAEIVVQNKKWVIANFKETQMEAIKEGQLVNIRVDALGGKIFKGRVSNLSPATGAKFSMVAPDNSTGNFVKITQRIPVRVAFTDPPEKLSEIKPGMNVSIEIIK
ncbi:HlyD family secretion protein [Solitalea koreensis]|uniref:Membrane fusion protein, multidrug efflux system n=1 Tax=Solitalea koreensis TaxID=543615 RepID=A0A521C2L6_9SPHI|nr:HlyD family secretion protein [Solitalea koreensis]SMO53644.1 membrane fusion protein, multidrug efflux system [Solitalea koreensis]